MKLSQTEIDKMLFEYLEEGRSEDMLGKLSENMSVTDVNELVAHWEGTVIKREQVDYPSFENLYTKKITQPKWNWKMIGLSSFLCFALTGGYFVFDSNATAFEPFKAPYHPVTALLSSDDKVAVNEQDFEVATIVEPSFQKEFMTNQIEEHEELLIELHEVIGRLKIKDEFVLGAGTKDEINALMKRSHSISQLTSSKKDMKSNSARLAIKFKKSLESIEYGWRNPSVVVMD